MHSCTRFAEPQACTQPSVTSQYSSFTHMQSMLPAAVSALPTLRRPHTLIEPHSAHLSYALCRGHSMILQSWQNEWQVIQVLCGTVHMMVGNVDRHCSRQRFTCRGGSSVLLADRVAFSSLTASSTSTSCSAGDPSNPF